MDSHADIKDKCDGLENRLDEIAADIRDLPFHYKLVDKYMFHRYTSEKQAIEKRIEELNMESKSLNNEVQNLKLQAFSRVRHGGSYSQLPSNQHP